MSIDPYRDMAEWLDMTPAEEARLRHPAGKGSRYQARLDNEALRVGNREPWWMRRPWCQVIAVTLVVLSACLVILGALWVANTVGGWIW